MSVTTNVPEQQLFFPGGAWTEAFERGLSNVSKWKCTTHGWRANWKMWNRVSRVQSLLNCFERFVGVCVRVRVSAWQKDLAGLYAQWDCTAQETQVSECGESARSIYQRTQRGVVG